MVDIHLYSRIRAVLIHQGLKQKSNIKKYFDFYPLFKATICLIYSRKVNLMQTYLLEGQLGGWEVQGRPAAEAVGQLAGWIQIHSVHKLPGYSPYPRFKINQLINQDFSIYFLNLILPEICL